MDLTGIEKHNAIWERIEKIREQKEVLEMREQKVYRRYDFITNVLKPFGKSLIPAVEQKFGKKVVKKINQHQTDLKFYGPFGMCSERSLVWCFTDGTEAWLHMAQGNRGEFSIDTHEKSNNVYHSGSIGDLNGFGKKRINITKLTEEQVVNFIHLCKKD